MGRISSRRRTADSEHSWSRCKRYGLNGSSREGRGGVRNGCGAVWASSLATVLREEPVKRAIARTEWPCWANCLISIHSSTCTMPVPPWLVRPGSNGNKTVTCQSDNREWVAQFSTLVIGSVSHDCLHGSVIIDSRA